MDYKDKRFFDRWGTYLGYAGLMAMLGLLVWLYLPSLGSYPYRDWDESIYAQVARESMAHPLAFTWLGYGRADNIGNLWFEKPPLVIWLLQASYYLIGVGEFPARLVTFLFGLATVALVFFWARHITKSAWAGVLASTSLLACFHFLLNIGILNLDIPVGFFMALSLYGYSRARENKNFWYLFWVGLALGALSKSIVGLVPLGIVAFHQVITFGWRITAKEKTVWYGFGLFLLLLVPWHIVETVRFGSEFWQSYFGYHVFDRFINPIENNGNVWWYYFTIFKQIPFGIFAIAGLVFGLYQALKKQADYLLLCLSAIFIFILFTLAQTKGSGYIVVIYPCLAVLIGCMIHELSKLLKPVWLFYFVVVSCLILFMQVGVTYNTYRLTKMNSPVYTDLYEIADWIKGQKICGDITYIPMSNTSEILDARPLLVYLTNQVIATTFVNDLPVKLTSVYRTRTHVVYQYKREFYVRATMVIN